MRASDLATAYALSLELDKLRKAQEAVRYIAPEGRLNFEAMDSDRVLESIPIKKQELADLIDQLIKDRQERLTRLGVEPK